MWRPCHGQLAVFHTLQTWPVFFLSAAGIMAADALRLEYIRAGGDVFLSVLRE